MKKYLSLLIAVLFTLSLNAGGGKAKIVFDFTKEPVAPAGTGSIDVTFDPEGRPGTFRKEVKVYTNAGKASIKLIIEGIVVPKK